MIKYIKTYNEFGWVKFYVSFNGIVLFYWVDHLGLFVEHDEEKFPREVQYIYNEMCICDFIGMRTNEFNQVWENL